jgi:hypothetical protein
MPSIGAKEITQALEALSRYDFGSSTDALWRIDECARAAHSSPELSRILSGGLNRMLESDAPLAARQYACKTLWVLAPNGALPGLAKMLASADVRVAEAACYAIGDAPSADADRLVLQALQTASGQALVAIINLAGDRRIGEGLGVLTRLAAGSDEAAGGAAIAAIGKLGTPEASGVLKQLAARASGGRARAIAAAQLECAQRLPADAPSGFAPLFNGRDLSEWDIDTPGVWEVRNGVIIGRTPGLKYNDFLRTKKTYENFELRARVRMIDGVGNSGIQFRSKPAAIPHEVEGYQADAGERYWGALYDESRRNKTLAGPDESFLERLDPTAWHRYEISAQGNRIRLAMDGVETVNYEEQDSSIPRSGIIALQVHAWPQPVEVWFRELTIRVL